MRAIICGALMALAITTASAAMLARIAELEAEVEELRKRPVGS